MKLWISEEKAPTHCLVRFNAEEHSNYKYLGDLNDEEIKACFKEIKHDLDLEENLKIHKYFGYLHLFAITKKK